MADHHSPNFDLVKLEDSWMLQAKVTKVQNGDWLIANSELEELLALLTATIVSVQSFEHHPSGI